jgi:DNA-binding response OmpR family regulator
VVEGQCADGGVVLIVEDDADTRAVLRWAVEAEGRVAEEVASAGAALARVGGPRPALIILDLNLRGFAGEVVAAAFGLRHGGRVPILVVSAQDDAGERTRGLRGVRARLAKPVDPDALRAAVRDLAPPPGRPAPSGGPDLAPAPL